jgi:hypothetical protein
MSRRIDVSITRHDPQPALDRRAAAADYLRVKLASALLRREATDAADVAAYAAKRWGRDSWPALVLRAGVAAADREDLETQGHSPRDAFIESVFEASIPGRLARARRVPFKTRILNPSTGASGAWIAESQAVPASRVALEGVSLEARKVGALTFATKESLADPQAEPRVFGDLTRACVEALDAGFLGAAAASAAQPAGLVNGLTPIASAGDPAADVAELVEAFSGDLSQAVFVTDGGTAAAMALHGGQAFAGVGVAGGSLLGAPLLTSRISPSDSTGGQILLLDETALALALDDVELTVSTAASIEADDEAAGDAGGPTASSQTVINLFQTELIAWLVTIHANWRIARPGAVTAISGASYGGS